MTTADLELIRRRVRRSDPAEREQRLGARGADLPQTPADPSRRPDGWEGRLVAKLEATGRLTPGYAVRVLREGELALFEHALAALGGTPRETVRAACEAEGPGALAEACRAGGIDRSVFPVVLGKVRELNGGRPGDAAPAPRTGRPRPAKTASSKPVAKTRGGRREAAAERART